MLPDNIDYRRFYIDGAWIEPAEPRDLDVINPATEEAVATISLGSSDDVDRAVAAARRAEAAFAATTVEERKELLAAILTEYDRRRDDIGHAIMLELGAPIDLARGAQAGVAYGHLKAFMKAIDEVAFTEELANGDTVLREPAGIAALITPWNWPIHQICLKVLAALAAGCPVILKPSESTPLCAMIFADVLDAAGCPPGVFNLINGDGPGVGVALARHPDIDLISFTGSTRAGISVSTEAARTVKRVTLELGGKSPSLIFADADLEAAVHRAIDKTFPNSGQNCNAPTRVLVERSVYDEAKVIAARYAAKWEVGPPDQPGDHIGPVANARQFDHVQRLLRVGVEEGATVLAGGPGRPAGFDRGHYVRPTVFADVTNDMDIAREEIFGPVIVMIPFDDEDEAVAIANDTPYGLAAYVHSGDSERIDRLVPRLRAGMVFRNGADIGAGSPFGGYKRSGFGREGGVFGIEEFLELKLVA